ncbi:phasin family protein [Massilia arenosa]|uniref:Phasin family protein n=1 Tax=Zemynaea arenosa TaxID=2561931 RepID=A0A4Y9SJX9_9BURK|nr:phasin family protein [Massilia arenosa]TFW26518.1 phasin family protein [Massilia arenosa]
MNALVQTPALQSHLNAQVSLLTELTNKVYDAAQRMTEMNLRFAQQCIQDCVNASRHMLSATDPVEFGTAAMACAMPASEHVRSYQQQLMGVLTGAQVELTRTAEQHMPEASRTATAVADEVVRRSTEATEKIAAEHRQAMERMNSAGQQAMQGMQQGMQGMQQGVQSAMGQRPDGHGQQHAQPGPRPGERGQEPARG